MPLSGDLKLRRAFVHSLPKRFGCSSRGLDVILFSLPAAWSTLVSAIAVACVLPVHSAGGRIQGSGIESKQYSRRRLGFSYHIGPRL